MSYEISFNDKVIVITGASGVIGSQLAIAFAKAGGKVALLGRKREALQKYVDEISTFGGVARAYTADVLNKDALEEVRQQINLDLGKTDILINGAGGNSPKATTDTEFHELDLPEEVKTFLDLDKQGIEFVFNLNYLGTLLPIQVFAQDMVGRKGTNIINIASMNAFTPLTKIPAYSGAKAAIANFTQWLAVHFSHVGIRTNAIAPGFLVTHQNIDLMFEEDHKTLSHRGEKIIRSTPMGRFGEPSELVGGVFFLACDKMSGFVNGVVLPIDGGFNSYSNV